MYSPSMTETKKSTSMILDFALVERARAVLETEQTTETVHEALGREAWYAQDRRDSNAGSATEVRSVSSAPT